MTTTMVKKEISIKDALGFANALSKAMPAVAKNTTVPILTGIHVEADAECITITGSDDKTLIRVVEKGLGMAIEPVAFVVPGRMFSDIVKRLPKGEFTIHLSDTDIILKANKSSFELKTMPVEDYPLRGSTPFDISLEIEPMKLAKGFGTGFAASTDNLRPTLHAVHLSGEGNTLSFVATDAHRLSKVDVTLEEEFDPFKNILVPAQSTKEIISLLKEEKEKVTIQFNEREFRLITEKVTFSTRLIEGTYPDLNRIIPQDFKTTFDVNREEIVGALERVNIVAQESNMKCCRFQLAIEGIPSLLISATGTEVGKAKEQVFLGDMQGESFKFAISTKYLLDCFKQLSCKDVVVYGNSSVTPFVFRPKGDECVLDLILPVRLID
ncbi:Beta sliding clamp [Brevibacillus sp. IT-7CA2]|uniref:DNA polymerase III subunit beta n=1 Tax=Brevibacillus sp. IT-7CA2 TaxID=3026436 RepID=UPI0039E09885